MDVDSLAALFISLANGADLSCSVPPVHVPEA